jgi:hypothetical protein
VDRAGDGLDECARPNGKVCRDFEELMLRDDAVFRHSSVNIHSERAKIRAKMDKAFTAVTAGAARYVRIDRDSLPGLPPLRTGTRFGNRTGILVTKDDRRGRAGGSLDDMDVGPADSANAHSDENFARTKRAKIAIHHVHGMGFIEEDGFHKESPDDDEMLRAV